MDAKEYLLQVQRIKTKIQIIKDQLLEIDTKLYGKAIQYDKVPTGTGDGDPTLRLILKRIEVETDLKEEQIKLYEAEQNIRQTLFQLNDSRQIQVLYMRYFQGKRWEVISAELNYTIDYIMKLHRLGLTGISEIIN